MAPGALLLLFACHGQPDTGGAPPLPASLLSPVPPGVPLDLDLAEQHRQEGRYEQAVAIYNAVAQQGEGQDRLQALWGLSQLYLVQKDYRQAAVVLSSYLTLGPDQREATGAHYLLALASRRLGRPEEAEEHLRRYLDGDGAIGAYARLQLADILVSRGRPAEAIAELERALEDDLPPAPRSQALFALAAAQESAGDAEAALAVYEQLLRDSPWPGDRPAALWNIALLSRGQGDEARWQQSLRELVSEYPADALAAQALDALSLNAVPVDGFQRGLVLFHQRRNQEAVEAFEDYLASAPPAAAAAQARYYLGLLQERLGDPQAALREYESSLQLDRQGELAAAAAWWRAQLLEASQKEDEAAAAYLSLWRQYPDSDRAQAAVFRAGLLPFRQGRYAAAIQAWSHFLDAAARPSLLAKAHFWLGKAALAVNDGASAQEHFRQAAAAAPADYYGLRSQAFLAGGPREIPLNEAVALEETSPDWTELEAWLEEGIGQEDVAASQEFLASLPWQRGRELWRLGLTEEAAQEFALLLGRAGDEPPGRAGWLLYRLARSLQEMGAIPTAARAAQRLLGGQEDPPLTLYALAYPQEFLGLTASAVRPYGFSPLLLLALVRQESLFDAGAISAAGALGLTQVIPSTGREIARQLDEEDFREGDLLRPVVSLRFGAHYLHSQLGQFAGDLVSALAAYNGGPGNARRWQEAAGADPDLFLEAIDLAETRAYVQLVLENYAAYRYLFGLTDRPSLAP